MAQKSELISKAIEILESAEFEISNCDGVRSCFDIIAKREETFLIKVLPNIEGMNKDNSAELMDIADLVSGIPLIIGHCMKSSKLSNDVVYERYGIRIVNLKTFENVLNDRIPQVYSVRGNYCMNINSRMLVQLRRKFGITQEELAVKLSVSKQSIYRYESSGTISIEIAERLMEIFGEDIAIPNKLILDRKIHHKPKKGANRNLTNLEETVIRYLEDMGFSTQPTNAPFDIFARETKEGNRLFTIVSNDGRRLRHRIELMYEISELLGGYKICISDRRESSSQVPIIKPKELHEIKDSQELIEMIETF